MFRSRISRMFSVNQGLAGVFAAATMGASLFALAGCERVMNGPKQPEVEQRRPDQVLAFDELYGHNCAACHGQDGKNGTSIPMNNPVYMAVASDARIRAVTAGGQPGTLMPAFGRDAGGLLTDAQIDAIVHGMRERWGKPMAGLNPPPYAASSKGDAVHGALVYSQACANCHGAAANEADPGAGGLSTATNSGADPHVGNNPNTGVGKAGSVVDPTFLALLSDQALRTIIIAGRPDIGQPDWRGDVPGHPLTDAEITDVVAWMATHRQALPGQTHPDPAATKPGATELQRRTQS